MDVIFIDDGDNGNGTNANSSSDNVENMNDKLSNAISGEKHLSTNDCMNTEAVSDEIAEVDKENNKVQDEESPIEINEVEEIKNGEDIPETNEESKTSNAKDGTIEEITASGNDHEVVDDKKGKKTQVSNDPEEGDKEIPVEAEGSVKIEEKVDNKKNDSEDKENVSLNSEEETNEKQFADDRKNEEEGKEESSEVQEASDNKKNNDEDQDESSDIEEITNDDKKNDDEEEDVVKESAKTSSANDKIEEKTSKDLKQLKENDNREMICDSDNITEKSDKPSEGDHNFSGDETVSSSVFSEEKNSAISHQELRVPEEEKNKSLDVVAMESPANTIKANETITRSSESQNNENAETQNGKAEDSTNIIINLDENEDVIQETRKDDESDSSLVILDNNSDLLFNISPKKMHDAESTGKVQNEAEKKLTADEGANEKKEEKPSEDKPSRSTNNENTANGKKAASLVDYQVQCVNLHCQSGFDLAEAPVFVLTYFGVLRRKNVLQKVCRECFNIALKHQTVLADMLKNHEPVMKAHFPGQKDDVVVMELVDEIYEEDPLSPQIIAEVEENLMKILAESVQKYDLDYQVEEAENILKEKYKELEGYNKGINDELEEIERKVRDARHLIYKDFTPRIKSLPALNIIEPGEKLDPLRPLALTRGRVVATKKVTHVPKCVLPPTYVPPTEPPSHDIVSVVEVEIPQSKLPPIGMLSYPPLLPGDQVYVMKLTPVGVWVKGKIVEVCSRSADGSNTYRVRCEPISRSCTSKIVTGKQIAYSKPSAVRYPVGTRVIAIFQDTDYPSKEAFYVGLIAEPPKHLNKFRYLVFFDDGYAQYVQHEKILLVCESSKLVYEDVHPDSREFIKKYLDQYPERPMVKLQQGQIVRTEWNGKWWIAKVVEIDCSLAKMHFDADKRTEWIYRGSTRLGPLYAEIVAATARKEQGALSRHRSLGIASLKKRNLPYVEYSVEQDDVKAPTPPAGVSKNVAKKSTAKPSNQETTIEKPTGPPKPFEKMEYPTKGYVRVMELPNRVIGKPFVPHQCGPSCIDWTKYPEGERKGINPLAIPLFYGFERQVVRMKGKRAIMYKAPCGRRLRNMVEMHRYLRITKSAMGLELFDYDYWVHVLDEFHLEPNMYCTYLKDISYGRENNPVPCVNEINHSWPLFMDYSTKRIPQNGVNICLDEEFLVCCDCTDDCQDKEKCECWQLTIEGTKLGPGGEADPTVGYHFKRLPEAVTTGIYECNQRCKCNSTCLNRVAQHPLQLNLQVFRTLKKGWGLRAVNDIPKGGFICIYAGRLHTEQSANDGGRMYGDEYLAELDYIEVVERFKEGYESEVIEPDEEEKKDEEHEEDEHDEDPVTKKGCDDKDYVPLGLGRLPNTESIVNTRGRKKRSAEEKSESERDSTADEKEESETDDNNSINPDDDDDEIKKKPSKFTASVVDEDKPRNYKSVRELFGDGADDCYIMDAKSSGNIGRYLNHSCQPNVFVQNVFVDTHDVRFPWVAFFALSYIKAGTELTWDYNYDIGSVPDKVLYCYCNNADCRGRLL